MSPALIDQAFSGHGVALRREDEPPIPGEPFISMYVAKEICSRLLSSTPALDERERLREAVKVGERFVNACFSAWAAGEPSHRVRTMLDLADEFRSALASIRSGDAG